MGPCRCGWGGYSPGLCTCSRDRYLRGSWPPKSKAIGNLLRTLEEGNMKLAELNTEFCTAKQASEGAIKRLTVENAELHASKQALEAEVLRGLTKPPPL
ncbi:hypothetical protein GUJ93_ZPchr0005g14922 [Zizania palustris]|uniref:Uncharacterized protein n=1 Tax=Zizania palustris TaxID=103762 RepID=A0A8J5SQW1_ZIZPA|nr:hypothetical protein GUJ93_ZPchr0005g14922 [Zizania palustris]